MQINDPAVVAEVSEAFGRYERALVERDLATMDALFWDGAAVVRYGIADIQHGGAEVAAFRRVAPTIHPSRRLMRTVVTTFGADAATVSTEFTSDVQAGFVGRQMQTWVRFADGWRIVAAHVSLVEERVVRAGSSA